MTTPNVGPETIAECARQLILIGRDLRAAGDVGLVRFTDDGLIPAEITLADELELIAMRLDFDGCMEHARDSEGPT